MRTLLTPILQLLDVFLRPASYPSTTLRRRVQVAGDYFWDFMRWQWDALSGPRVRPEGLEPVTVILLSHKRAQNIQPMVRSLLKVECIRKIIVSSNNPDIDIFKWIVSGNERVELINQSREDLGGCGHSIWRRFLLAREEPGEYFLAIDDDIFLFPRQVALLCRRLQGDPSIPHGIQGSRFRRRSGPFPTEGKLEFWDLWACYRGRDLEVDVLNQGYAFTRQHVAEMLRLASEVGIDTSDELIDDVVLSFAGEGRPRLVDVGPIAECLSGLKTAVAAWTTVNDWERYRLGRYMELAEKKPLR